MQPKLLRDPKTDVTAHGHEQCPCGMCHVPIHSDPHVHAGTQSHVARGSDQQNVTTTAVFCDPRNAVVLRVQLRQGGADEPFPGDVLRFVGSVREPKARLNVIAQASRLRAL